MTCRAKVRVVWHPESVGGAGGGGDPGSERRAARAAETPLQHIGEDLRRMKTIRVRLGAAVLIALLALSAVGGAAQAQHGSDDPCPHHVENLPGCK